MVIRNLTIALLFVALAFMNIGGCGGGGGNACDFVLSDIFNGPDAPQADSLWDCIDSDGELFDFQVFGNETGVATEVGLFVWEQTGCRRINIQFEEDGEEGEAVVKNIQGSIDSGELTFDFKIDGETFSAECFLVIF